MRSTVLLGLLLLAAWSGGLFGFVRHVDSFVQPSIEADLPSSDAIVVLTGGSERLMTGIGLLRAGKGKKLFISGVYPGVSLAQILRAENLEQETKECCIILGHAAENTRGNAIETRSFMHKEGFSSMRLVTAHYHMPRALLLFKDRMPDISIAPHPVLPNIVDLASWWRRAGTLTLLVAEYNKYLFDNIRRSLGLL